MVSLIVLGGAKMLSFRKQRQETSLRRGQAAANQSLGQAALKISDYLTSEQICFFPEGTNALRVFSDLIGTLSIPNREFALEAVLRREQVGGTIVAPGIALPHARIDGTDRLHSALALCPSGIKLSEDEPAIRLLLLFVSPFTELKNHLRFLAAAAALFQDEMLCGDMIALKSSDAILEKLKHKEMKTHAEHSTK
ncbi:MAG TPA: PTS sugar transporter subunit IIA [Verrucomicrobiae bacterium]|nr:PTS sugar transporter subunit IIA [Verrucomicrobiae bacterium]